MCNQSLPCLPERVGGVFNFLKICVFYLNLLLLQMKKIFLYAFVFLSLCTFNACVMSEHLALDRKNIVNNDALIGTWMVQDTKNLNSDVKDSIIISKIDGAKKGQYMLEMTRGKTKETYTVYVGKIKKVPTFVVGIPVVKEDKNTAYFYGAYKIKNDILNVNFLVNVEGSVNDEPNKEANEFHTLKEIQDYLNKNINNKTHYKETITFKKQK